MQFSNWVRAILRNTDAILQLGTCGPSKTVPFLSSSGPWGGRIRYAPTSGYVRPFKKLSCFRPLRDRGVGVCDTPLQPGTCEGSKNGSVFATVGGVRWAYAIRPYNRIRVILRNTDAIPQLGTCCPSKKCPVFVPYGAVCGAYSIRPYNRVRAILRNTDAILQLGTCGPSKNCPVFVPFGAVCGAYSIRPYNWVRTILRNTDAIS